MDNDEMNLLEGLFPSGNDSDEKDSKENSKKSSQKIEKVRLKPKDYAIIITFVLIVGAGSTFLGSKVIDRAEKIGEAITKPCTDLGGVYSNTGGISPLDYGSSLCVLPDGTVVDPSIYGKNSPELINEKRE